MSGAGWARPDATGDPWRPPPPGVPPVPADPAAAAPVPADPVPYPPPQPPGWAPAAPPPAPYAPPARPFAATPHDAAQPYPRLLRTRQWRWWRPLLGLVVAPVSWLLLTGVLLVASAVLGLLHPRLAVLDDADAPVSDPLVLLAGNLAIITMALAAVVAVVVAHVERPGWLVSVTGAVRGALLVRCAAIAVGTVTASVLANLALGAVLDPPEAGEPVEGFDPPAAGTLLALLVVIALSTPLQATAEEVFFRGYLTQAVASYGRSARVGPLLAAAVTAALFAAAHLPEDAWLVADLVAFALVASWVTWRTGGLEAAVALHVVNNLIAIGVAAVTGTLEDAVGASTIPWPYAVADIAAVLAYAVAVQRWARPLADRVTSAAAPVAPVPPAGGLGAPSAIG